MNVSTSHDSHVRLFPVIVNHDNDGATPQSGNVHTKHTGRQLPFIFSTIGCQESNLYE